MTTEASILPFFDANSSYSVDISSTMSNKTDNFLRRSLSCGCIADDKVGNCNTHMHFRKLEDINEKELKIVIEKQRRDIYELENKLQLALTQSRK